MLSLIHPVESTFDTTLHGLLTAEGKVDNAKLITHNKAVIIKALSEAKVETLEANYEGQGDSGSFVNIVVLPDIHQELSTQIKTVKQVNTFNQKTKTWKIVLEEKDMQLDQAIEDFTYELVAESGHEGYENGHGGNGIITFNVDTKEVTHDHYDNFVDQEHSVSKY